MPRFRVPPDPFIVKAAPFTFPIKVTVPAVLVKLTNPVVVNPSTVLVPTLVPIKRTEVDANESVPILEKLPTNDIRPAPVKDTDPVFVKLPVPDCVNLPVVPFIAPALLTVPEIVSVLVTTAKIPPEFTVTFTIEALAPKVTVAPFTITTSSLVAGATPPTHVLPVAHGPPVVVLVLNAAYTPFTPTNIKNKIPTINFTVGFKYLYM